jgi:enoyl-CoA hydratase
MPIGDSAPAILFERLDGSAIIRFNKPEIRNPLGSETVRMLIDLMRRIESDGGISKTIFTGRDSVFASGADIREIAELSLEHAPAFGNLGQKLMDSISKSSKPTIAAVNGFCFGGGLDLAISCSRRVASPSATFCHPGAGLGIITGWGGTQRLPRLIGSAVAIEMFMTGKVVDANEALRIGLIEAIAEDPLARALEC